MALLFEKPSLRTRVSFEAGMIHLGGSSLFLGDDVGFGARESIADFGRVLSEYVDVIVVRTKRHETVVELAKLLHLLGDQRTDRLSPIPARPWPICTRCRNWSARWPATRWPTSATRNNVARSLAEGCGKVGMRFVMATPHGLSFRPAFLDAVDDGRAGARIRRHRRSDRGRPRARRRSTPTSGPAWARRRKPSTAASDFADYQVNAELMAHAPRTPIFMHCLPAHRGEEVTDEVIDGPQSVVVQQAANRLHVQKGILAWLLSAAAEACATANPQASSHQTVRTRLRIARSVLRP